MAKYCKKCGAAMQDDAMFCANCSERVSSPVLDGSETKILDVDDPTTHLVGGPDHIPSAQSEPFEQAVRSTGNRQPPVGRFAGFAAKIGVSKGLLTALVSAVAVVAVAGTVVAVSSMAKNKQKEPPVSDRAGAQAQQTTAAAEPLTTQPPVAEETKGNDTAQYDGIIQQFRNKWDQDPFYVYSAYCFHDIDEDGQDELIVHDGIGEQDRTYYFYTVSGGKVVDLGMQEAWHAGLADSDKKLILYSGMNGEGDYWYITVKGDRIASEHAGTFTFPPTPDFGEELPLT